MLYERNLGEMFLFWFSGSKHLQKHGSSELLVLSVLFNNSRCNWLPLVRFSTCCRLKVLGCFQFLHAFSKFWVALEMEESDAKPCIYGLIFGRGRTPQNYIRFSS